MAGKLRIYFLNFCFEKFRKRICKGTIVRCFWVNWVHRFVCESLYNLIDSLLISATVLNCCAKILYLLLLNKLIYMISLISVLCDGIGVAIF